MAEGRTLSLGALNFFSTKDKPYPCENSEIHGRCYGHDGISAPGRIPWPGVGLGEFGSARTSSNASNIPQ